MGVERKGFIYTLESVIAAGLILGSMIVVMPDISSESNFQDNSIRQGLESLDKRGELKDNISAKEIENELELHVPPAFNHEVRIIEDETINRNDINTPYEIYINKNGDRSELQLWIDSANNMNITFAGKKIVDQRSEAGYLVKEISKTEGYLNFTGSGNLDFEFDIYKTSGTIPDQDEVFSTNYLVYENGTKEIQVKTWEK